MKYIGAHRLEFPQHGDERGHLVIVEGQKDIPFDIKRIFYIYGSDKMVVRGKHANGKGNGSVFLLDRPHTGIYLPCMVWKEMYDFSEDSVLLCLASEYYDGSEYIREYDEYLKIVEEKDK